MAVSLPIAMNARPSLETLPAEILEAIFIHLDPRSLISVSRTSRTLKKSAADAPIIWRHYCLTRFNHWASHHNITAKSAAPLSSVDWHGLFAFRTNIETNTRRLLDKVLQSQQDRIEHINEVAAFGYDAKDTLLKECACPDDAEDVLARRFWANAMLGRIHREMALSTWKDLVTGKDIPIETALGSFDLFTRTGEEADYDVISGDLDRLAKLAREEYPDFQELSTRRKASTLATFMRDWNFRGVGESSYHALRNSFIGVALRSPDHESLPLISVAIYCALARRLDLDARPCGFIFHVYCLVYAPKDYDLDGRYKPTSSRDLDYTYMDPFRSSDEIQQSDLERTLREMNVAPSERQAYLSDSTTRDMALRTSRNIMNSVVTIRQAEEGSYTGGEWVNAFPDPDSSFYATIWAFLVLGIQRNEARYAQTAERRRQYMPYLIDLFQTHYQWDLPLLEQYLIPLYEGTDESDRMSRFVQSMRDRDHLFRPVHQRTPPRGAVTFKVGQLFKHKRYGYEGMITGWDATCDAGEDWIGTMGVDRLRNGRDQSFYHVVYSLPFALRVNSTLTTIPSVYDQSVRYVAEENIEPVSSTAEPSEALLRLAGRYFKRWDKENHTFVEILNMERTWNEWDWRSTFARNRFISDEDDSDEDDGYAGPDTLLRFEGRDRFVCV